MSPDRARRLLPLTDEAFEAVASTLPAPPAEWDRLAPGNAPGGLRFVYQSRDLGSTGGPSLLEREPVVDGELPRPGEALLDPLPPEPRVHRSVEVFMSVVATADLASLERDLESWRERARQGFPVRVLTNGFDVSGPGFAPGWDADFLLARRFRVVVMLGASDDVATLTAFLESWDLRATEVALLQAIAGRHATPSEGGS